MAWIISAPDACPRLTPVPGDSRFSWTVPPMILDLSCIPAVVLIVEDEMILRMFAVDMVEDAGYSPVEAVDADEAIALLESRSDIALIARTSECQAAWTASNLRAPCINVGRRSRSSWYLGN